MAERDGQDAAGLGADFFVGGTERDRAQLGHDPSKRTLPKRFYTEASVGETADGYAVLLDGRPVRTPRQTPVAMPTRAAAELLRAEWAAQGDTIDPSTMPVTRLVNAALDGVAAEIDAVAADVVKYAGSDLLCYRAAEPPALVAAQAAAWDPVLAFVQERFGARLALAEGIMFVAQPREAITAIARAVEEATTGSAKALKLAALHTLTTLTGSALIALTVAAGALSRDAAWTAAHVDEDEQMRVWGVDAEAMRRRAARFDEFSAACALYTALC